MVFIQNQWAFFDTENEPYSIMSTYYSIFETALYFCILILWIRHCILVMYPTSPQFLHFSSAFHVYNYLSCQFTRSHPAKKVWTHSPTPRQDNITNDFYHVYDLPNPLYPEPHPTNVRPFQYNQWRNRLSRQGYFEPDTHNILFKKNNSHTRFQHVELSTHSHLVIFMNNRDTLETKQLWIGHEHDSLPMIITESEYLEYALTGCHLLLCFCLILFLLFASSFLT